MFDTIKKCIIGTAVFAGLSLAGYGIASADGPRGPFTPGHVVCAGSDNSLIDCANVDGGASSAGLLPVASGNLVCGSGSSIQDCTNVGGPAAAPAGISFTNNIVYSGASGPTNSWIYSQKNISGAPTNGVDGLISPYHLLIAHDTVTSTADVYGFSMKLQPDTGHSGGRTASLGYLSVIGAPDPSTNNPEYVGIQGLTSTGVNLGGTTGSLDNAVGFLFGGNSNVFTSSGATFLSGITSWEFDTTLKTGSSAGRKHGFMIVKGATDAVSGTYEDSAIEIADQSGASVSWTKGLEFGSYSSQWPFGVTSTLIGATQRTLPSPDSPIALYGVDLSAVTFQAGGGAFKSTGFLVDPSGNTKGNTLISGTAGATGTPAVVVGNATTGLYSVSTTGLGLTNNGTTQFDFGITTAGRLTATPPLNLAGTTAAALTLTSTTSGISLRNGGTLITSQANASLQLGAFDAASPVAQTIQPQSVAAGNANTAGATFTINGSKSNGSGGGDVVLQTTLSNASSGVQNTLATALTLKGGTQAAVFAGNITAAGLATAGTIAGSICATSAGLILYESGASSCTISLRALKMGIETFKPRDAIDSLMALKPVSFAFKSKPDQERIGFIAEDTKAADPRFATYDSKGDLQAYDPNAVLATLVAVVQQQQKEISDLKRRIALPQ